MRSFFWFFKRFSPWVTKGLLIVVCTVVVFIVNFKLESLESERLDAKIISGSEFLYQVVPYPEFLDAVEFCDCTVHLDRTTAYAVLPAVSGARGVDKLGRDFVGEFSGEVGTLTYVDPSHVDEFSAYLLDGRFDVVSGISVASQYPLPENSFTVFSVSSVFTGFLAAVTLLFLFVAAFCGFDRLESSDHERNYTFSGLGRRYPFGGTLAVASRWPLVLFLWSFCYSLISIPLFLSDSQQVSAVHFAFALMGILATSALAVASGADPVVMSRDYERKRIMLYGSLDRVSLDGVSKSDLVLLSERVSFIYGARVGEMFSGLAPTFSGSAADLVETAAIID